jgi:hypothetical protein
MAITNTLTDLIPTIFAARDTVSRELVGFLNAVQLEATAERLAVNQVCRSFAAPAVTSSAITRAMQVPDGTGQTITNKTLSITTEENVNIPWSADQKLSMNESGVDRLIQAQFAQAMRTLTNKVELAVAAQHIYASRAYGDGGTNPFASSLADTAQLRKILSDNGAPLTDLQLVLDTTAGAAYRTLSMLTKVNESGDNTLLRQGNLGMIHGFNVRESGQVKQLVTSGTGASATTNTAGYAVGATTITLASAGTGTILAGDVVRFTGHSDQYVVLTGDADVSNGGTIVLAAPGLRVALAASAIDITVEEASTRNMAFDRNAIGVAIRAPAMGNDAATDSMLVTDTLSGITFDVRRYAGYGMEQFSVGLAWGVTTWKPEHVALLLG